MSSVELRHLSKSFDGDRHAVENVNLSIHEGEFVVFLGPSGCGKTTTLRMIAGFEFPTEGQIFIGGEDVTRVPPRRREIGMVFQNYALFQTMTVAENVAFGLRQRRLGRAAIDARVDEMLRMAQISAYRDRYPAELSGGQQQRVALVRALAISPRMLLMDEPLGALDQKMREIMQVELKQLQQRLGITTVFVTHDQQEAMSLADRIVVMEGGKIRQIGAPTELYERPNSQFVAEFIGKNNILTGTIKDISSGACIVNLAREVDVAVQRPINPRRGESIVFCVRPEHIDIVRHNTASMDNTVVGTVEQTQYFGNRTHYLIALESRKNVLVEKARSDESFSVGERVGISWSVKDSLLLDA